MVDELMKEALRRVRSVQDTPTLTAVNILRHKCNAVFLCWRGETNQVSS